MNCPKCGNVYKYGIKEIIIPRLNQKDPYYTCRNCEEKFYITVTSWYRAIFIYFTPLLIVLGFMLVKWMKRSEDTSLIETFGVMILYGFIPYLIISNLWTAFWMNRLGEVVPREKREDS